MNESGGGVALLVGVDATVDTKPGPARGTGVRGAAITEPDRALFMVAPTRGGVSEGYTNAVDGEAARAAVVTCAEAVLTVLTAGRGAGAAIGAEDMVDAGGNEVCVDVDDVAVEAAFRLRAKEPGVCPVDAAGMGGTPTVDNGDLPGDIPLVEGDAALMPIGTADGDCTAGEADRANTARFPFCVEQYARTPCVST